MRGIMLGNMMDGFSLVTKDDGNLWEDEDDTFYEAMNMLASKHKDGENFVLPIDSSTVTDELNVQPLVEGVDY
jgi:hypothetical protein